jgi:hypothetical protein
MGNRYLAANWTAREFLLAPQSNAGSGQMMRQRSLQTVVDLDNDSKPNTVYRMFGSISGNEIESLVVSSAPLSEEMSDAPISYTRYLEVMGTEGQSGSEAPSNLVTINVATAKPNSDQYYDPYYFYEIVRINNRQYILAARSAYWDQARVSMFEYRSPHDLSLICQFRANYRLVRSTSQ